ncbi:hypothetical protein ACSSS7_007981 [Eimeria intestinalis]
MFESQLLQVQEKLSQVFVDKFEQLQCGVDALNERLSVVEREFAIERDKQAREADEKNAAISNDISALQPLKKRERHAFESDKGSRQERELQLAKRLGDLEYRTEGKFEAEKVSNSNSNNSSNCSSRCSRCSSSSSRTKQQQQ